MPYIQSDIEPYMSPLADPAKDGPVEVTSRSQRREEMKRYNVREVDPSEREAFSGPDTDETEKYLRSRGVKR